MHFRQSAASGDRQNIREAGDLKDLQDGRIDVSQRHAALMIHLLLGAEQEDPDCLYGLGRLYAYGDAWQENYGRDAEKAVYYLQKAGERGDALNILGELYEHGVISNDWSSAEDGSLTAETTLEADPVKALDYYRRALECESPSEIALINLVSLGKELQEGRGLEMNVELAEEAFRIAAEHGSEEAQQLLQGVA